jgi:AbrB family looped-hinge helix DNA binding protein
MDTNEKNERSDERDSHRFSWDDHFYGSVTVGERGQVVIPAEARKRFRIEPGDKLLIMGDPGKRGLMLCRLDTMREFMSLFQENLARVEREMDESAGQENTSGGSGARPGPPARRERADANVVGERGRDEPRGRNRLAVGG